MTKTIFNNRKSVIALIAVMAAALVLLTACGGKGGLEGTTWKYTYDLGSYYTVSFANGTYTTTYVNTVTGEHESESASYRINGNQVIIDGKAANWEIKGNTLIITQDGQEIVFERH